MTFKELKNKIKEEQKELAKVIRKGKFYRKPGNRTDMTDEEKRRYLSYDGSVDIDHLRSSYRHTHIMYCDFFNHTPYDKIETNPRPNNLANGYILSDLRKKWESEIDEDVRNRS